MMKTRPQMTIVEERISSPDCRSTSPKKRKTRPPYTSRKHSAVKRAMSPKLSTQPRGTANQFTGPECRPARRRLRQLVRPPAGCAGGPAIIQCMADLERRSPSPLSRRRREQRAYRLVLATVTLGVIAVVGIVLAIAGVIGGGIPFLAAVLAAVCGLLLRRTLSGR